MAVLAKTELNTYTHMYIGFSFYELGFRVDHNTSWSFHQIEVIPTHPSPISYTSSLSRPASTTFPDRLCEMESTAISMQLDFEVSRSSGILPNSHLCALVCVLFCLFYCCHLPCFRAHMRKREARAERHLGSISVLLASRAGDVPLGCIWPPPRGAPWATGCI